MLFGSAEPSVRCLPDNIAYRDAGQDAIDCAATAGLMLDPWQQVVLRDCLAEREDRTWAAYEVGIVVPRQNGKGSIIEARELAGLFYFEEELILHSAHEFQTASEGFLRVKYLIEQNDDMVRRVEKIWNGHGAEGIQLFPTKTIIHGSSGKEIKRSRAPRLKFVARTGGSGRGLTGDCVFLDEAYRIPRRVIAALLPTLSARPNPQVWYTSSAVDQEEHEHGMVLARVRDRGIKQSAKRLYYVEWGANEAAYDKARREAEREAKDWRTVAATPERLVESNPGLGYRVSEDIVGAELEAMDEKTFKVERLAIGDWPPLDENQDNGPIKAAVWRALRQDEYQHGKDVVFAVDVTVDRQHSSVVAYSEDERGIGHVELIERFDGTRHVVPWLVGRKAKWKPLAMGVDGKSPTNSLIFDMERHGITSPKDPKRPKRGDLIVMTLQDMAAAVGQFLDAITDNEIRHLGNQYLDAAVFGAELRKVGDLSVWGRREATLDGSPLTAATIARWVYRTHQEALKNGPEMMFAWV